MWECSAGPQLHNNNDIKDMHASAWLLDIVQRCYLS